MAPAALAISAASSVCWAVSTAHGPAMKVNVSGPIGDLVALAARRARSSARGGAGRLTSL